MGSEEFQGDGPIELGVLGLIDYTHPALAELGGDLVMADSLANQDGDIVPLLRLLSVTIDVTNYQIFRRQPFEPHRFSRLQASARGIAAARLSDVKLFLNTCPKAIAAQGKTARTRAVMSSSPFFVFHFFCSC